MAPEVMDRVRALKVMIWDGIKSLNIELAERIFGCDNPLGRQIRIGDTIIRVIGVEAKLGNRQANSGWTRREMNGVRIPLATFRACLQGGERINLMTVKTAKLDDLEGIKGELSRMVRHARHCALLWLARPGRKRDWLSVSPTSVCPVSPLTPPAARPGSPGC
jgi:hypothetical protein